MKKAVAIVDLDNTLMNTEIVFKNAQLEMLKYLDK